MTRHRTRRPLVVLRQVPGESVIHRLWAGTKIVAVLALTLTLGLVPSWPAIGIGAAIVLGAAAAARIPRGVLPTLPWWVAATLLAGGIINIPSGGVPIYLRSLALGFVLLGATALIGWTTPLNEIAPALATLGAPLRWLRIPVDEWSVSLALCLRGFPILIEEFRVLFAARRLRPRRIRGEPRRVTGKLAVGYREMVDLVTAAIAVSVRRADELGEAITVRGGAGQITAAPPRPGLRDVAGLVLVAALCVGVFVIGY